MSDVAQSAATTPEEQPATPESSSASVRAEGEPRSWKPIDRCPKVPGKTYLIRSRNSQATGVPTLAYITEPCPPMAQTWRYASGPGTGTQAPWPTEYAELPQGAEGEPERQEHWEKAAKALKVLHDEQATRAEKAEQERDALRNDLEAAAGELLVSMPEPGTDMARLLIANRLLRSQLATLTAERDAIRTAYGWERDGRGLLELIGERLESLTAEGRAVSRLDLPVGGNHAPRSATTNDGRTLAEDARAGEGATVSNLQAQDGAPARADRPVDDGSCLPVGVRVRAEGLREAADEYERRFSESEHRFCVRHAAQWLRHRAKAASGSNVRLGYCLGSTARPHRMVEWQGCYTSCTLCHTPLRYDTVENVERVTGLSRPSWWAPEKVIGYRPEDRARSLAQTQPREKGR